MNETLQILPENEQQLIASETITESTSELSYYVVEVEKEEEISDIPPETFEIHPETSPVYLATEIIEEESAGQTLPETPGVNLRVIDEIKKQEEEIEEPDFDHAQAFAEEFYLLLEENFETVSSPASFDSYTRKDGEWVAVDQQTGELRTARELLGEDYDEWIALLQAGETIIDFSQSEDSETTWILATRLEGDRITNVMVEIENFVHQKEVIALFEDSQKTDGPYLDTSEVSSDDGIDLAIAEIEVEQIEADPNPPDPEEDYEPDFDYPVQQFALVVSDQNQPETTIESHVEYPTQIDFFEQSPDFEVVRTRETITIVRRSEPTPEPNLEQLPSAKPEPNLDTTNLDTSGVESGNEIVNSPDEPWVPLLSTPGVENDGVGIALAQVRLEISQTEEKPALPEEVKTIIRFEKSVTKQQTHLAEQIDRKKVIPAIEQPVPIRPIVEQFNLAQTRQLIEVIGTPQEKEILAIESPKPQPPPSFDSAEVENREIPEVPRLTSEVYLGTSGLPKPLALKMTINQSQQEIITKVVNSTQAELKQGSQFINTKQVERDSKIDKLATKKVKRQIDGHQTKINEQTSIEKNTQTQLAKTETDQIANRLETDVKAKTSSQTTAKEMTKKLEIKKEAKIANTTEKKSVNRQITNKRRTNYQPSLTSQSGALNFTRQTTNNNRSAMKANTGLRTEPTIEMILNDTLYNLKIGDLVTGRQPKQINLNGLPINLRLNPIDSNKLSQFITQAYQTDPKLKIAVEKPSQAPWQIKILAGEKEFSAPII